MGFVPAIWMGVQKRGLTAPATPVELIYGLMIGFLSHSHMVTKIILRFGKVKMNTLLNSGKIKVTANIGHLFVCPIQGSESRCRTY
jgi:hypothetical protein